MSKEWQEFCESDTKKEYQSRLDNEFKGLNEYPQIKTGTVVHDGREIVAKKYTNGVGIIPGEELVFEDFEEGIRKTRQLIDTIKSYYKNIWVRRLPDVQIYRGNYSVVCRLAFCNDRNREEL